MSGPADRLPYLLKVTEPSIGGGFIADASPDSLLGIQSGLIRRKEVQPYLRMAFEEPINFLSSMPTRSIHIEPNRIASDDLLPFVGQQQPGNLQTNPRSRNPLGQKNQLLQARLGVG